MNIINLVKKNSALIFILLLATFFRLYNLDFQSLWMDEIYTMNVSNPSFSFEKLRQEVILREGFPYFYFILLRFFYFFTEYSGLAARSVSAIAGVMGVYYIYLLGKELRNKNVGLIAALLLSINDFHILYSQEARPYTLFFLFVIISFYRLSIFIKNTNNKNAIYYGLSVGLVLNINFFGLITLFSQALIVLFFILLSKKENAVSLLKKSLISGGIGLLLFIPNYEILLKLLNFKSFWVPQPKEDSLTILFKQFLGNSEITLFLFGLIFFYYFYKLACENSEKIEIDSIKKSNLNFSFIVLFFWITTFVGVLIMKSYGETSLILDRYFITTIPVLILILAIGIDLIKNNLLKFLLITTVFIFSLFNLIIVKKYYTNVSKSQYREVSSFIIENNKNNEIVYTSLSYWYKYYLLNENTKTILVEKPLDNVIMEMMQDSTKIKEFWYADAHVRPFNPSEQAKEFLDANFYIENNFDGYDAWTKHFILLKNVNRNIDISKFLPLQINNGIPFNYNIENFETAEDYIKISGWAYFNEQDATDTKIEIVAIKEDKATKLLTQKNIRPDVTSYFKSNFNLSNTGFTSEMKLSNLESGTYQIGIYLKNEKIEKEGLIMTDKYITN
uniref:glycosyltransferase family 39 protein n=3 Tax=Flavobacterium sp. TaxID=239 RepID=UPI00404B97A4